MKKIIVVISILITNISVLIAEEDVIKKKEDINQEQSVWYNLTTNAQSLTEKTFEKASELSGDIGETYDDMMTLSNEKLNTFLASMNHSIILMEQLGYDISDIYLVAGIIPDLSFKVVRVNTLSIEVQNEILKQNGNGTVMRYMVNKLNQAYSMQVKGYRVKNVRIRVTLTPSATVHFVKNIEK
jgi:hypothetical protein